MSADRLISETELGGGRLALYPWRLVHSSEAVSETVPLVQLASVRIAFERAPATFGSAIASAIAAVFLLLVASPLHGWLAAAAARIAEPARRESLDSMLQTVLSELASVAAALPAVAVALFAAAAVLAALGWYGRTTLTLSFAATERAFSARGRHAGLLEFAEALSARLDALTRPGAA